MARVVTDDSHYKAIANAIRENSPEVQGQTFPPVGMPDEVTAACNYNREVGLAEGAAICAAKHFVHSFVGDGDTAKDFEIPFEPDCIHISCLDPTIFKTDCLLIDFYYDRRAFGLLSGFIQYGSTKNTSGVANMAMTPASATEYRYSCKASAENQGMFTVTIKQLRGATQMNDITYGAGLTYTMIAIKHTEQQEVVE